MSEKYNKKQTSTPIIGDGMGGEIDQEKKWEEEFTAYWEKDFPYHKYRADFSIMEYVKFGYLQACRKRQEETKTIKKAIRIYLNDPEFDTTLLMLIVNPKYEEKFGNPLKMGEKP